MNRLLAIALAMAAWAFAAVPLTSAAPAAPAARSALDVGRLPLISVHGCHRDVVEGRYGWHYHYGRHCKRYAVTPPRKYRRHYHRPRCYTECKYVGPIKFCKKKCR